MNLATRSQPKPQPKAAPRQGGAIAPEKLDAVLGRLEAEHAQLLDLTRRHRDAVSHASVEQMQQITTRTSEVLMRIARIEQERQHMLDSDAGPVATLEELLGRFSEPDRARLSERRQRLRELIMRVRDEQQAVREASENLANHMRALMKQVGASLSHAGTYSRGGAVDPSRSQVVSSLDMVR